MHPVCFIYLFLNDYFTLNDDLKLTSDLYTVSVQGFCFFYSRSQGADLREPCKVSFIFELDGCIGLGF